MAVAVKNVPETTPGQSLNRLAVGSLLGILYVVASLALLFYVIPSLWAVALSDVLIRTAGGAVDKALLILVLVAIAVGLGVYGLRQVGSKAPHGMRAGICVGLGFLILVGMLTQWVGRIFENVIYRFHLFGEAGPLVGMMTTGIIGLALLAWGVRLFFRPNFEKWLIRVEDLGWLPRRPTSARRDSACGEAPF